MWTYTERDLSRKRSSYLEKKFFTIQKQLQLAYEKLDELEAIARLFGKEELIRTPSNSPSSGLTDQQLLDRHLARRKFHLIPTEPKETQTK